MFITNLQKIIMKLEIKKNKIKISNLVVFINVSSGHKVSDRFLIVSFIIECKD